MTNMNALISMAGHTFVLRVRPAEASYPLVIWLSGGDNPKTEVVGCTPMQLDGSSTIDPQHPDNLAKYNPNTLSWNWKYTSWGKRLTHRSELDGAMLWAGMAWRGGRIGDVEWPWFPQNGTLIRAFFGGIDNPRLRQIASDPKQWSTLVAIADQWELSEEFYQWRLKHDPEKTPDRSVSRGRDDNSWCSVVIPIAEIEKTLIPVPERILAMIRK